MKFSLSIILIFMNQILITAMWEVVMTSDLTHTLTRPLSQSVIMMTANRHIHKLCFTFIKTTEQMQFIKFYILCRILIKIRAIFFSITRNELNFLFFFYLNKKRYTCQFLKNQRNKSKQINMEEERARIQKIFSEGGGGSDGYSSLPGGSEAYILLVIL